MKTRDGKVIISCPMTDDTLRYGCCGTCLHNRNWRNTRYLKEGDPAFCDAKSVTIHDE